MNNLKGYLLAIVSSATFGTIPLFTLPLMEAGLPVSSILFYRMLFATMMLGGYISIRPRKMRLTRHQFIMIFGLGGIAYAFTSFFLFWSYSYIGSGVATTIHYLYPVTVSLAMILFFKEKPAIALFLSMVLSLAGVALLSFNSEEPVSIFGLILVLASVVMYAVYIVALNRPSLGLVGSLPLTFYVLVCSTLVFAVNAQFDGGIQPIPDWPSAFNLFMLGVVCTVVSNFTLIVAVKNIGATLTAALGTMEPLTAVCIGAFYFDESFTMRMILGISLILLAVLIVIFGKNLPSLPSLKSLFAKK